MERNEMTTKHSKKAASTRATHTITPQQGEFLMENWKHRGATAKELAEAMDTSVGMIRRLAMILGRSSPAYVERQNCFKSVVVDGKEATITFTRYYLTENVFAKWPRSAVFLLDAQHLLKDEVARKKSAHQCPTVVEDVPLDENGTIGIEEFKEHLKLRHAYTDAMFISDWKFLGSKGYIHQYEEGFTPATKIDAEEQYLLLLKEEYKPGKKRTRKLLQG
jgi:hypothetical protein